MRQTTLSRHRRLAMAVGLAAAVLFPGTILADTTGGYGGISAAESNGATIALVGAPKLMNRAVLTVDVTFTCQPFEVYDWMTDQMVESTEGYVDYGTVTVVQASGRTLVSGTSDLGYGTVVCDGTTVHSRSLVIIPQTGLYKRGAAVAGASIRIVDAGMTASHTASTGPISVSIGK